MAFDNQKTLDSTLQPEEWNNLLDLIPAGYVIYKKDNMIYAVPRHGSGNVYSGEDAQQIIQYAINELSDGGLIFIKKGTYLINNPIIPNNNLTIYLEAGAILKANADMTRLIDGRDKNHVVICGKGVIDGNGKVTKVIDFEQTVTGIVTHNRVEQVAIKNAKAVSGSCLIDITLNSGFQLGEPMLDGGGTTEYGIIQDNSYGQNTLYLGDYNNGFTVANIKLGGGALTIIGGALEGTTTNILITSENGNPRLRVFGTWMESDKDNILIQDNATYKPLSLDLEPIHMFTKGTGGYANVRSTTASGHHLVTLYVNGGYWENQNGSYHFDVSCEKAVIIKGYYNKGMNGINTSKMTNVVVLTDKIYVKGSEINSLDNLDLYLTVGTNKGIYLKDRGNDVVMAYFTKNGLVLNGHYIFDPASANASSVSNLVKVIKIWINGAEYYIPVYSSYS